MVAFVSGSERMACAHTARGSSAAVRDFAMVGMAA